jgi:hypothetical protein
MAPALMQCTPFIHTCTYHTRPNVPAGHMCRGDWSKVFGTWWRPLPPTLMAHLSAAAQRRHHQGADVCIEDVTEKKKQQQHPTLGGAAGYQAYSGSQSECTWVSLQLSCVVAGGFVAVAWAMGLDGSVSGICLFVKRVVGLNRAVLNLMITITLTITRVPSHLLPHLQSYTWGLPHTLGACPLHHMACSWWQCP